MNLRPWIRNRRFQVVGLSDSSSSSALEWKEPVIWESAGCCACIINYGRGEYVFPFHLLVRIEPNLYFNISPSLPVG